SGAHDEHEPALVVVPPQHRARLARETANAVARRRRPRRVRAAFEHERRERAVHRLHLFRRTYHRPDEALPAAVGIALSEEAAVALERREHGDPRRKPRLATEQLPRERQNARQAERRRRVALLAREREMAGVDTAALQEKVVQGLRA